KPTTSEARELLAIIKQHISTTQSPLNMSEVAELAGITSKRRLQELIGELEYAGAVCTRQLAERGRPRVIELRNQPAQSPNATGDEIRTNPNATARPQNRHGQF